MTLTSEEKQFLLSLISQVTIKPSASDSAKVVEIVQSLITKLSEE
jgi:hypothetical protein